MKAVGEFLGVVMRIKLGPQIDVALRPFQRPVIFAHVFGIGIAGDHVCDHEGAVDHLAETQLLGEIIGPAEERGRRHFAVDEQLHAPEQKLIAEGQIDLIGGEILLQRLDGRGA